MGIISPKAPTPSIQEMAESQRDKQRAEKINKMSDDLLELVKDFMLDRQIAIGDIPLTVQAVTKKIDHWIGSNLNQKTVNQIVIGGEENAKSESGQDSPVKK